MYAIEKLDACPRGKSQCIVETPQLGVFVGDPL
jgi:hypothetical protein